MQVWRAEVGAEVEAGREARLEWSWSFLEVVAPLGLAFGRLPEAEVR